MSRIGKLPIPMPNGVELTVADNNVVTVKGAKGTLVQKFDSDLKISVQGGQIVIERPTEQKRHKALHGLTRALLNNMVVGVSEGYKLELELVGVGYRASNEGQLLELAVGYSHPIFIALPDEVKLSTDTQKGKAPRVILESIDKQLVGQVAARLDP